MLYVHQPRDHCGNPPGRTMKPLQQAA
jgi:hypothetical protein